MTAKRPICYGGNVTGDPVMPGDLVMGGENILGGSLTTVGAGTWTGTMIANGIIRRTGPTGAYTDTTDTSTNIVAALAGNMSAADLVAGSTFRLRFINTVAQAMTLAAGTGVALGTGTTTTAASLWREYLFTILNASATVTLTCTTVNASAAVTFALPSGAVSLPIGNAYNAVNITPGMTVSGTNVTAGTTVLSVTQGQGGIIGITLNANATGSGTQSLTFLPTVQIDSLGSGTL